MGGIIDHSAMRVTLALAVALAVAAAVVALPVDDGTEDVILMQTYSSGGGAVNDGNATEAAAQEEEGSPKVGKVPELIPTPPPPTPAHLAKIKHYIKKIKEFQKAKNQKWEPLVEQDLAEKLALVDSFEVPTPEELDLEAQLRKGSKPQFKVEMSLRRYDQAAAERKKQKEAEEAKGAKEVKDKAQRKQALLRENKDVAKQIAKYKQMAVSKQLMIKSKAAARAVKRAVKAEAKAKKSKHYKAFAKEYSLNESAEKAGDYPKGELGEAKKDRIVQGHIERVDTAEFDSNSADLSADERLDQKLGNDALALLAKSKKP